MEYKNLVILIISILLFIYNIIIILNSKNFKISNKDINVLILVYALTYSILPRDVYADYEGYKKYIDYVYEGKDIYNEPLMVLYFYTVKIITESSESALEIIYLINFFIFIIFAKYISKKCGNINAYLLIIILGSTLGFITLRATPAYIIMATIVSEKKFLNRMINSAVAVACHYSAFPIAILFEINKIKKKRYIFIILSMISIMLYFIYLNIETLLGSRYDILNIEMGYKFLIFAIINIIILIYFYINREKIKEYKLLSLIITIGVVLGLNTILYVRYMMYAILIYLTANKIKESKYTTIIIKMTSPFIYYATFWYVLGNL